MYFQVLDTHALYIFFLYVNQMDIGAVIARELSVLYNVGIYVISRSNLVRRVLYYFLWIWLPPSVRLTPSKKKEEKRKPLKQSSQSDVRIMSVACLILLLTNKKKIIIFMQALQSRMPYDV